MSEKQYKEYRAKLINEFWFLRSRHCPLSAKARVRKIAELDHEQKGVPKEITFDKFNYYRIK